MFDVASGLLRRALVILYCTCIMAKRESLFAMDNCRGFNE